MLNNKGCSKRYLKIPCTNFCHLFLNTLYFERENNLNFTYVHIIHIFCCVYNKSVSNRVKNLFFCHFSSTLKYSEKPSQQSTVTLFDSETLENTIFI